MTGGVQCDLPPMKRCRFSKTTSVVPAPWTTCGSARMTVNGSWLSLRPGTAIGSSGNAMPRSQSHVASRQPSVRHRLVRSRVAAVGSQVVIQIAEKAAWTSSRVWEARLVELPAVPCEAA